MEDNKIKVAEHHTLRSQTKIGGKCPNLDAELLPPLHCEILD